MKPMALAIALVSSAAAGTITLTMNEVPTQPIDHLTVSIGGESFFFANASGTLFYNSSGPGVVTYVQDPSIYGATAQFAVSFSVPVTFIQFGMAEIFGSPLTPMATVDLFLFSTCCLPPPVTIHLNSSLVDPFTEGQFTYSGAPVVSMIISPNLTAQSLAFDNLIVTTVPEPSTLPVLSGMAVLAVAALMKRRAWDSRASTWCAEHDQSDCTLRRSSGRPPGPIFLQGKTPH